MVLHTGWHDGSAEAIGFQYLVSVKKNNNKQTKKQQQIA